jgi:hypothetical protein
MFGSVLDRLLLSLDQDISLETQDRACVKHLMNTNDSCSNQRERARPELWLVLSTEEMNCISRLDVVDEWWTTKSNADHDEHKSPLALAASFAVAVTKRVCEGRGYVPRHGEMGIFQTFQRTFPEVCKVLGFSACKIIGSTHPPEQIGGPDRMLRHQQGTTLAVSEDDLDRLLQNELGFACRVPESIQPGPSTPATSTRSAD